MMKIVIFSLTNSTVKLTGRRSLGRDASNRHGTENDKGNVAHTPSGGEGIVDSMQDATKIESATTAQAWRTQEVCTKCAEVDEHQTLLG